jgi:PHD/YefM family antitoxin component YafN of YafNO toxin-antitoxin module
VLISKEDYDNLIENLYILSNPKWVKSIERGLDDFKKGKKKKLSVKQALGL